MSHAHESGTPRWAPRVPPHQIRRLYERDALGILDEELLDEVAYGLYARCRSILTVTQAARGTVRCPRCDRPIARRGLRDNDRHEVIRCPACAWQITWGEYFQSYQHKGLHGGSATGAFERYVEQFERARTPSAKMLAVDRLIHAVHQDAAGRPTRPAARNVIEGSLAAVCALLDGLASGEWSTPGTQETRAAWGRDAAAIRALRSGGT